MLWSPIAISVALSAVPWRFWMTAKQIKTSYVRSDQRSVIRLPFLFHWLYPKFSLSFTLHNILVFTLSILVVTCCLCFLGMYVSTYLTRICTIRWPHIYMAVSFKTQSTKHNLWSCNNGTWTINQKRIILGFHLSFINEFWCFWNFMLMLPDLNGSRVSLLPKVLENLRLKICTFIFFIFFIIIFKAIGTIFHGKFITSKLHGILGFGFILWFSGSFSRLHYYSQSVLVNGKISGEVF